MRRVLLCLFLLAGCAGKPETPLAGLYEARIGQVNFDTTATSDLRLGGQAPFSGEIWDAAWKRDGDTLTITTRPKFKNKYQIKYTFDVINDGAQLILRRADTTTEATGETETTKFDTATEPDLTFNKHN